MCLRIENLSFMYHNNQVLRDVNFSLDYGKYVCIIGKNGAGKTTLFKCILNILSSYCGCIYVDNKELRHYSVRQRANIIAYIPQTYNSAYDYSVFEMILMGTTSSFGALQQPGKKQLDRALTALRAIDIENFKERKFSTLSGGERQLVMIARAVAQNARILLLDEPCTGLDYGNQIHILNILKSLSKEGYLVLQITHNPDHVFWFADEVLVLENGSISDIGTPENVLTETLIERVYNTPVAVCTVKETGKKICVPFNCYKRSSSYGDRKQL